MQTIQCIYYLKVFLQGFSFPRTTYVFFRYPEQLLFYGERHSLCEILKNCQLFTIKFLWTLLDLPQILEVIKHLPHKTFNIIKSRWEAISTCPTNLLSNKKTLQVLISTNIIQRRIKEKRDYYYLIHFLCIFLSSSSSVLWCFYCV